MAIIALPATFEDFARVTVELEQNYQVNRSAWTGRRRVTQLPGVERWFANFQSEPITTEADERAWRAFLIAAGAAPNYFRLPVACNQTSAANPVIADSAANVGNTLVVTGLPPSATVLKAGQYMTIPMVGGHKRLVMLIADLVSNAFTTAVATFLPGMAGSVAVGSTVEIQNPYLLAAMVASRQGWTTENGQTVFTIDAEEAL